MGYMARDPGGRSDARRWFPAARSLVLTAWSYADGAPEDEGRPGEGRAEAGAASGGRVARYARAGDYHRVVKERLKALLARVREAAPGARGKVFVDTSPVLERLYGRRAGIGWTGKNTMLLNPRLGSYSFLGGLALDLDLETDEPLPDHCGGCNRCIEACPTDAFPAPRTLDATRCIAYLTIEHRGPVPEELRPGLGDWIFGCDICQEVCPFNRFAVRNAAFPPLLPARLPLERAASLTPEEFGRDFEPTPVERAGRAGLARNALVAMGNSKDARFIPVLEARRSDPDPLLADAARWSLARLRQEASPA